MARKDGYDEPIEETLTLLRHHLKIASELTEQLAATNRRAVPPEPVEGSPAPNGKPNIPASKRDVPLVQEVLDRGTAAINEAAIRIMAAVAQWPEVGEAIPERPRDGKPPTYVRFTKEGKTFAYLGVRRDHLRIDLAIPPAETTNLRGQPVRVRDVKSNNPWKVSLYVRNLDGVEGAIEGIAHAYEWLFDQEPAVAE